MYGKYVQSNVRTYHTVGSEIFAICKFTESLNLGLSAFLFFANSKSIGYRSVLPVRLCIIKGDKQQGAIVVERGLGISDGHALTSE